MLLDDDPRHLVVEPRWHTQVVGAVVAPVDPDPFLRGRAVAPLHRPAVADFLEISEVVSIVEIVVVRRRLARKRRKGLVIGAGEASYISPYRTELRLSGCVGIGAVFAVVRHGCGPVMLTVEPSVAR
ncbi:MAG TPA: hypothetical protein VHT50_27265 [Mycobacterium sp.]|nr:hypothetical protein [Mycobacterium sp.]